MKSASVTELKNSLSAHLKDVERGESLLVTDHRKPVAILQPLGQGYQIEQLIAMLADGLVSPPAGQELGVKAFLKRPKGKASRSLTEAVTEDRDAR